MKDLGRWKRCLKTQDLNVFYGGIHALKGSSIDVPAGEIVTIIGSNGAGKSSLLNAISGMVKYTGSVEYEGKPPSEAASQSGKKRNLPGS